MTEKNTLTMKDLEGKEVYLRPTGNNVRYTDTATKIIPAKIIKVSRIYATFILDESWVEEKGKITDLHLDTGCNSGYQVFPDKQTIDDLLFVERVVTKIIDKLRYDCDYEKLDRETITKIANRLGIQTGD